MSESSERKIKLLLLYEILRTQTDERHPMTTKELSAALQKYGITVSRQTLYEDIEVLNRYGFDIVSEKGKRNRYYIDSHTFERPEIEILLQAVCSSNFLTEKKKTELLNKVSELFGTASAREMSELISDSSADGKNEHIYYSIDAIMTALLEKKQITFRYYDYGLNREKLYARINLRVDKMLKSGLVSEVRALLKSGVHEDSQAMHAIGYKEVISFLKGEIDEARMVELIKQHSRNYAKRQLTFLRGMENVNYVDVENIGEVENMREKIASWLI